MITESEQRNRDQLGRVRHGLVSQMASVKQQRPLTDVVDLKRKFEHIEVQFLRLNEDLAQVNKAVDRNRDEACLWVGTEIREKMRVSNRIVTTAPAGPDL